MTMRKRSVARTIAVPALLFAQPVLAQTITCQDLKMLQESGQRSFADLNTGNEDIIGDPYSSFTLPGAEKCTLQGLDSRSPSFSCVWRSYDSEASAQAVRTQLQDQVKACLPANFKSREHRNDTSRLRSSSTVFSFGYLQPEIKVGWLYSKRVGKYMVSLDFRMSLPDD